MVYNSLFYIRLKITGKFETRNLYFVLKAFFVDELGDLKVESAAAA